MNISDKSIDGGKPFDWGRTSADYAKYRDIYPESFYESIINKALCTHGQRVLDLGTGTGVLPSNMYKYGARWTGTDISENQIAQARLLSEGMDIDYLVTPAEDISFPDNSFDVVTACQCFWYFDHKKLMPKLYKMLKPNGSLLVLYMAWLPSEDKIAGASEALVLKYNPNWSGAGETVRPIAIPEIYREHFESVCHEEFCVKLHFTAEGWHGRMKACRGVGASLSKTEIESWEQEHLALLSDIAPKEFDVLHYIATAQLKKHA